MLVWSCLSPARLLPAQGAGRDGPSAGHAVPPHLSFLLRRRLSRPAPWPSPVVPHGFIGLQLDSDPSTEGRQRSGGAVPISHPFFGGTTGDGPGCFHAAACWAWM